VLRFINGLKAQGTAVKDAKVLFYGAGSSAVGVANMIATLLEKEGGLSEKEAKEVQSAVCPCKQAVITFVCFRTHKHNTTLKLTGEGR